jgi:hypothetical protein
MLAHLKSASCGNKRDCAGTQALATLNRYDLPYQGLQSFVHATIL